MGGYRILTEEGVNYYVQELEKAREEFDQQFNNLVQACQSLMGSAFKGSTVAAIQNCLETIHRQRQQANQDIMEYINFLHKMLQSGMETDQQQGSSVGSAVENIYTFK